MQKTKIEWVKNPDSSQGYTLNDKTGCLNHVNGMCKGGGFPCYAYRLAHGRLKKYYLDNRHISPDKDSLFSDRYYIDPFYPRQWPERLDQIRKHKMPKGIFLDDMSDWMGDYWPEEWTRQELQVMRDCPQHRFYTLTKQPQNLIGFSPFPDNCWVGVTVCTNGMMTLALQYLSIIKAKVKFISFEPLLGSIGIKDHMSMGGIVDWIIIGAQTKPYKPPRIEWAEEIVGAADKAGIPIFLKDNLKPLIEPQGLIKGQWAAREWVMCKHPILRQELPENHRGVD